METVDGNAYSLTASTAPPGMSAPGTSAPPGVQQQNSSQQNRGGFPPNFQPPANMPNINFAAPVIRLGTTGPVKSGAPGGDVGRQGDMQRQGRAGLGASSIDGQRQARENMMTLVPPTKDEIVRTIFVGGITEGTGGDEGIEKILQSAGNLKKWIRAMDADNKPCRFGFAEYEDPDSLATAIDVLKNVEVPVKPQSSEKKDDDETDEKVEKSSLLVSNLLCNAHKITNHIVDCRRRWYFGLSRQLQAVKGRPRSHSSTITSKCCQERSSYGSC